MSKYAKLGPYHWIEYAQQTAYGRHARRVRKWIAAGQHRRILDIGAGDGLIAFLIDAEGVDVDPLAVQLAQERDARVTLGSANALPFEDAIFDAAYMGDVIEHLDRPEAALAEARRVMQPGGVLYVVTPPKGHGRPSDPYHVREYSPPELFSLLQAARFEPIGNVAVVPEFVRMYIVARRL